MTNDERLNTAIHEAGHTAAAWCLAGYGAILGPVTIVEEAWLHGSANVGIVPPAGEAIEEAWHSAIIGMPISAAVRDWAETDVMIRWAGGVAEWRAAEREHRLEVLTVPRPETAEQQAMVVEALAAGKKEPDSDRVTINKFLRAISASPAEVDAYRGWLLVRTWQLADNIQFWSLVEALSAALLDHDTLEKEEVLAIIHNVVDLPTQAAASTWSTEPSGYIEDD